MMLRRAEEGAEWNLWADAPKGAVKGGIEMREQRIALTTSTRLRSAARSVVEELTLEGAASVGSMTIS